MRKIFCIGFNKTGTASLYSTMAAHGIRSLHHGVWALASRTQAFEIHVNRYGTPPQTDHSSDSLSSKYMFHKWQDYDFFADGSLSRFDLLDQAFPGSYFIYNTRSLYNWLTSRYNYNLRTRRKPGWRPGFHIQFRNRDDPIWHVDVFPEPSVQEIRMWIVEREEYSRKVFAYFEGRDNFAVINVEADDEADILAALGVATGKPIKKFHTYTANFFKNHSEYVSNPEPVEAALERQNIPECEWHRTLL